MANERKIELDGLRGYAAIVVVIYHSVLGLDGTQLDRVLRGAWSNLGPYEIATKLFFKVFDGELAVTLFFILSGAVLFKSLKREDGRLGGIAVRFYVRRFFRIYPALLASLVACGLAFTAVERGVTMQDFVANALLYDFKINGATWTINAEMIAPVFMLLCYAGYRAGREWGLAIVVFGLMYLLTLPQFDGYLVFFRISWLGFALGMLIPTRIGEMAASVLPRWSWAAVLIVTIILRWPLREICIALFVATIYYRRADGLDTFLSNRISQFLGKISYSFYLFNVLFLELLCDRVRQYPWAVAHPLEAGACVALLVIACTTPVAYLSWAYIEMPFNRLGHRLTGRRHAVPAVPQSVPS